MLWRIHLSRSCLTWPWPARTSRSRHTRLYSPPAAHSSGKCPLSTCRWRSFKTCIHSTFLLMHETMSLIYGFDIYLALKIYRYMKKYARDRWPTSRNRGWRSVTVVLVNIRGHCRVRGCPVTVAGVPWPWLTSRSRGCSLVAVADVKYLKIFENPGYETSTRDITSLHHILTIPTLPQSQLHIIRSFGTCLPYCV